MPPFALGKQAVFDDRLGAEVDAGHAVDAVSLPVRAAIFNHNIANRADIPAGATGTAVFRHPKAAVLDDQAIKQAVDRAG